MENRQSPQSADVPAAVAMPSATAAPEVVPTLRRRSNTNSLCSPGPAARNVLKTLERVLASHESEALLLWPQRPDSVAVFHALASLSRLPDCHTRRLATLLFPWTRNTAGIQRSVVVDRDFLDDAILQALKKVLPDTETHAAFGYLMALHSLRHILASGKKDKRFRRSLKDDPGLAYPTLFEIMPQCGIKEDGLHGYADQFLRRLRRHTWIGDRTQHIDAATDPCRTPFFLFGVHSDGAHTRLLRGAGLDVQRGGRKPDLVLIDLTRGARGRLEPWRQATPRFLGLLTDLYGRDAPPALAITEDVFVLEALRWDVLKKYDVRRTVTVDDKRPRPAAVILSRSPDPLCQATIGPTVPCSVNAEVYGTDVLNVVDTGLKLRRSLLNAGEQDIASAVTAAVTVAQAIVGLPGSQRQLHDFLTSNYEGRERDTIGSRYDHLTPISKMRSLLDCGVAGQYHGALSRFLSSFDTLCCVAATESPGQKLFDEQLRRLLETDERLIVVCSSEFLRGFVEWRVETDPELDSARLHLAERLLLLDRREAVEELDVHQQGDKRPGRILFVEPFADDLLHVLTSPWRPTQALILTNLARAEQILRRVRILLDLPGTEAVRPVLADVQVEFDRVLQGRVSEVPDLEAEIPLPRLGTIDLTVPGAPGYDSARLIATSSGLRIRAFDGSEVALYDPDALQVFSRKRAKDLTPGDQICVFSLDFVAAARERLNLTADAPEVLSLYHNTVIKARRELPGVELSAQVAALRQRMLAVDPTLDLPGEPAMRHWLDVAHLIDAPRHRVRPQAPRDRHHYLCFMKALGVGEEVSRHYWDWGIFWTRSMRIRSGSSFHQVFMGILVDPHGTVSRLPEKRRQEVWRIYETAEQHVVTIVSNDADVNQ